MIRSGVSTILVSIPNENIGNNIQHPDIGGSMAYGAGLRAVPDNMEQCLIGIVSVIPGSQGQPLGGG